MLTRYAGRRSRGCWRGSGRRSTGRSAALTAAISGCRSRAARRVPRPGRRGEWLDDRIVRTPPQLGPWTAVLYAVAEAARGGGSAAAAAVRDARALSEWDQWHLYGALARWRSEAPRTRRR